MVMNNFYDAKKLSFFALETFDFYSHLKTLNSIPSYLVFRSLSSSFADGFMTFACDDIYIKFKALTFNT